MRRRRIWDRPKAKWPYWVLYDFDYDSNSEVHEAYQHWLIGYKLKKEKVEVVIERQWGRYTSINGRKHKTQTGVLYKFLNPEDRMIFILREPKEIQHDEHN